MNIERKEIANVSKDAVLKYALGSDDNFEIFKALINTQKTHEHYKYVCDMAEKNKILATGHNIEKLLQRFDPRESVEAFNQRVRFTKPITPAIYNSIKKPFSKAGRNANIKINVDAKSERYNLILEEMRKKFYAAHTHSKSKGLDNWLKDKYLNVSFIDPNAWISIEWEKARPTEIVTTVPHTISSAEALNYSYKNNELEWLFVKRVINFNSYNTANKTIQVKQGIKYILYAKGKTYSASQCCKNFIKLQNITADNLFTSSGQIDFFIEIYDTKIDVVPAFRLGYVEDVVTDMKTFVSPFEPAMCYFEKSLKLGSEFDLSTMLHAFPQKTELIERCQGTPTQKCNNGYVHGSNSKCQVCDGLGVKSITSALDVRLVPMPQELEALKDIDLSKLTHYDSPPVELLDFQNRIIESLKLDAHMAVFSSTIYASKEIKAPKTATEVIGDFDGVYDALEPFTEKISELFKDVMLVFMHIAGMPEKMIDDSILIHKYPEDLKLKTNSYLLSEMKRAKDAGAPTFFINSLVSDLAQINYSSSPSDLAKFKVKEKFYPFNGKSQEEIIILMSSTYISEEDKILYANFETIFKEIEIEHPAFYHMNINEFEAQWQIVKDKIKEFKNRIDATKNNYKLPFSDIEIKDVDVEEEEETENFE